MVNIQDIARLQPIPVGASIKVSGAITQTLEITQVSRPFGGQIPLWICEGCRRRAYILYGVDRFLCRRCHGLNYQTQHLNHQDRLIAKARAIRQRLSGSVNLLEPFPPKPRAMRWKRYWQLRDEAEDALAKAVLKQK